MAFLASPVIIFVVAILSEFDGSKGDPCSSYKSINDPHRSTKYKLSPGERGYCDIYLIGGWYRFTSIVGGKMPTTKPEPYHCGTVAPLWMNGSHPTTKGETRDYSACTSLNGHACLFPFLISVKNCGTYFVYRLSPTRGCSMAYCAGDRMPCRKGLVGIVPNCAVPDIIPFPFDLVPTPKITYQVYNTRTICLHCNFSFPLWKNVSFDVQWFKDGRPIEKHNNDSVCQEQKPFDDAPPCSQRHSVLGPSRFKAGHRITCNLRMRYNTNPQNNWTASWTFSEGFYVGIKVEPSHFVTRVSECGGKKNFTFQPTIPLLHDANSPLDHVPIKIYIPQSFVREGRQSAIDDCILKMRGTDVSVLEIKGICDNVNEVPSVVEYHFQLFHTDFAIWGSYTLPSIRVTVENTPIKTCRSRNDPRYKTFDNKPFSLVKQVGDFVLYKNRNLKIEVHTRVWVCNTVWSATCNCGVAIRSGGDVIVVTVCDSLLKYNNQLTYLRTQIRSTGPLARGTHIYKKPQGDHLSINVHLPSGIRIEVQRFDWGMNIFIRSYQSKSSNTSGLCGNFNGKKSDEFYNEEKGRLYTDENSFGESWRINASESYFKILPGEEEDPYKAGKSCQCPYGNVSIEEKYDCTDTAVLMQSFDNNPGNEVLQMPVRSKRETAYHDDIMEYEEKSFFEDDHAMHFAERRIRSKRAISEMNDISQENATLLCKNAIEESTAGKTCSQIQGVNFKLLMMECVADLMLTRDTRFVESAFESMKSECEEMALRNISLYTRDANGKLQPPMEIGNKLCPNDCSNHGNCTNRTCICEKGFTAADCSMAANAIPELLGIYDGGLCDIRKRPCKKTDIFGQDFIDSENLTCHAQEFKVVESVWTPRSLSMKYSGSMEDLFVVRCKLSDPPTKLGDYEHEGTPVGGLLISISNDGEHKSKRQMRFISYDSVCMACNKTGNCTLKTNSCLIRGHCFAANQSNPRNNLQKCIPAISQHFWTPREELPTTAIPKTTTPKTTLPKTTLPKTTTEPWEVVIIIIEIRILLTWESYYEDTNSEEYRSLADYCIQQIYLSYRQGHREEFIILVDIFLFRPGSVIAEFKVKHKKNLTDPLEPIRETIKDGKMGNLSVDPTSLKIKPADNDVDDDPSKMVLIIVLVVVGVLLILVAIIIAVVIKKRRRSKSNEDRVPKRSKTIPPEAYEMPGKASKEHHAYAEPRAPAVYENAGFGQQDSTPNHYDEP